MQGKHFVNHLKVITFYQLVRLISAIPYLFEPVLQFKEIQFFLICFNFNFTGKENSTGNLSSDLRTWLSAALVNQETCSDGFEGTNSIVKGLVSAGLNQVTSLVQTLLTQVHPVTSYEPSRTQNNQFPSWLKPKDRKLIQGTGVSADVVVAADGTGNFTKVTDAVLAAPDYSMKRYVIYIKRGVYKENVEIKKKKWNLMIVGDGMDATIISGNRSFVDGWTTFRSATFGKRLVGVISLLLGIAFNAPSSFLTNRGPCFYGILMVDNCHLGKCMATLSP